MIVGQRVPPCSSLGTVPLAREVSNSRSGTVPAFGWAVSEPISIKNIQIHTKIPNRTQRNKKGVTVCFSHNYAISPTKKRSYATPSFYMVPREGIGPPTPAFSGPRSTTELPRLYLVGESSVAHHLWLVEGRRRRATSAISCWRIPACRQAGSVARQSY